MIFNDIKCHVNTSLGLVGEMHPLHPPVTGQEQGWAIHMSLGQL